MSLCGPGRESDGLNENVLPHKLIHLNTSSLLRRAILEGPGCMSLIKRGMSLG